MATARGKAVFWHANNFTFTGFDATEPTGEHQSISGSRTSETKEVMNANGDVVSKLFHSAKKTMSLSVVPSAATRAAAAGNVNKYLAPPATIVTVADSDGGVFDADNAAKYNLLTANVRYTNNGEAVVDIEIEQFDNNDVAVAVT